MCPLLFGNIINSLFQCYDSPVVFDNLVFQFSNSLIGISVKPFHEEMWNQLFRQFRNYEKQHIFNAIIAAVEKFF